MFDRESELQTYISKWLRLFGNEYGLGRSALLEYKLVRYVENSRTARGTMTRKQARLNLNTSSTVKEIANLHRAKHGCVYHKMPDVGIYQRPADAFLLCNSDAWFLICFDKKKTAVMYIIDVDEIINLRADGAASMTEDDAKRMAAHRVEITKKRI